MIKYDKLIKILNENGISSYNLTKKNKIIGQATYNNIMTGKHIDTRTINALCAFLKCQPGDLLEYIPDQEDRNQEDSKEDRPER